MRLDVLDKRNSTGMDLTVHTEMHPFDRKEHSPVPGVGHIRWMRQVQSLYCRSFSLGLKIVVMLAFRNFKLVVLLGQLFFFLITINYNLLSNWFPHSTQCSSQQVPSSVSWASLELKVRCVWHTRWFFSLPLPSSPFSTNKLLILKNKILYTNGHWRSVSSGLAFSNATSMGSE